MRPVPPRPPHTNGRRDRYRDPAGIILVPGRPRASEKWTSRRRFWAAYVTATVARAIEGRAVLTACTAAWVRAAAEAGNADAEALRPMLGPGSLRAVGRRAFQVTPQSTRPDKPAVVVHRCHLALACPRRRGDRPKPPFLAPRSSSPSDTQNGPHRLAPSPKAKMQQRTMGASSSVSGRPTLCGAVSPSRDHLTWPNVPIDL